MMNLHTYDFYLEGRTQPAVFAYDKGEEALLEELASNESKFLIVFTASIDEPPRRVILMKDKILSVQPW